MRRGTPKGLKRGGRTRSAASKTKPRAERKDASSAALAAQLAAKTRELTEALAQQTATSEVLQVIIEFAWRVAAGVRRHARTGDASVRGEVR